MNCLSSIHKTFSANYNQMPTIYTVLISMTKVTKEKNKALCSRNLSKVKYKICVNYEQILREKSIGMINSKSRLVIMSWSRGRDNETSQETSMVVIMIIS